jgi:uncharacterized cupin superfamily protein
MNEATITDTDTGQIVEGDGWFVVNVADVSWERLPEQGVWCELHGPNEATPQFGIGVHVLTPGQSNGRYHAESDQEGFLVLSGECIALVEGTERHLRQWDYLHSPPGTEHILVGAGDGLCAILMVGARTPGKTFHYPADALAAKHGASVAQTTDSPREAYADVDQTLTRERAPWPSGA